MTDSPPIATEDGLEVIDLTDEDAFASRPLRSHHPDTRYALQIAVIQRIARALIVDPESILQALVDAAVEVCGADSSGLSVEMEDRTDERFYHWAATSGRYSGFLDAILPRKPSACGVCLERGRPQLFRVGQAFFDIMGIEAPIVTDGILLPWRIDDTRGTIFVMAHGRSQAFDREDLRIMQVLAEFAAMGVRQQRQQKLLIEQASHKAAAEMANKLAHRINNPLQSLTNVLFLAAEGYSTDAQAVGKQALADLERLSALVKQLLALSYPEEL
jgi:two-component sensor histidine kinase